MTTRYKMDFINLGTGKVLSYLLLDLKMDDDSRESCAIRNL
jgi:hypothetical protein